MAKLRVGKGTPAVDHQLAQNPHALDASLPELARLCYAVRARPAVKGPWAQHLPE